MSSRARRRARVKGARTDAVDHEADKRHEELYRELVSFCRLMEIKQQPFRKRKPQQKTEINY
ncbi:hypothetical protein DAA48_22055 [Aeromonas veronii]|uniref:Uncharacterized protein n=1 Tax=Aeromonas veronii TaxID=654 RepID=A0A2T4MWY7_AERVE|nr:hypothetical protein DAA48_22055 [Aeromonas veronii]